jgi:hypothetical protein
MKKETYPVARTRLLNELEAHGWNVKRGLKVPWAEHNGIQVSFRPQAVYCGVHSMWVDIRNMPIDLFLRNVEHCAKHEY